MMGMVFVEILMLVESWLWYVVIIMDGNNWWVKQQCLIGVVGYKVGVDVVKVVVEICG